MKLCLDVTSDYSYRELNSFLDLNTIPNFVKEGQCMTKAAADELPDEAFADTYNRAFPINSAADLYVSSAFFMNKRAELVKLWGENYAKGVEERITKAAQVFDITKDIESYNERLAQKQAADYPERTLVSFDIAGTTYDLFPYKTAADMTTQADVFSRNINNYPFVWRSKIASEFIKQAAELGVAELPDIICKYGGMFYPDLREFEATLARRMRKLSAAHQEKYQKCLTKAANVSSREDALQICAEAYLIEKAAGVYNKPALYREMGDIVDRTMTLDVQKIAEAFDVIKMDNDCYRVSDLQKISRDVYKEAFGCDINPENINELREVLPTMPGSDVALLRELSGISAC